MPQQCAQVTVDLVQPQGPITSEGASAKRFLIISNLASVVVPLSVLVMRMRSNRRWVPPTVLKITRFL